MYDTCRRDSSDSTRASSRASSSGPMPGAVKGKRVDPPRPNRRRETASAFGNAPSLPKAPRSATDTCHSQRRTESHAVVHRRRHRRSAAVSTAARTGLRTSVSESLSRDGSCLTGTYYRCAQDSGSSTDKWCPLPGQRRLGGGGQPDNRIKPVAGPARSPQRLAGAFDDASEQRILIALGGAGDLLEHGRDPASAARQQVNRAATTKNRRVIVGIRMRAEARSPPACFVGNVRRPVRRILRGIPDDAARVHPWQAHHHRPESDRSRPRAEESVDTCQVCRTPPGASPARSSPQVPRVIDVSMERVHDYS